MNSPKTGCISRIGVVYRDGANYIILNVAITISLEMDCQKTGVITCTSIGNRPAAASCTYVIGCSGPHINGTPISINPPPVRAACVRIINVTDRVSLDIARLCCADMELYTPKIVISCRLGKHSCASRTASSDIIV